MLLRDKSLLGNDNDDDVAIIANDPHWAAETKTRIEVHNCQRNEIALQTISDRLDEV